MSEKISGYLLLIFGLSIMVFCVVNIFMVFTNKAKPFSFFNTSSSGSGSPLNVNGIISQMQNNNPNASSQSIPMPKLDLIPPEALNQALNLSTHFFLMSFILGFGYKLANLGIQLIRTINVKLKSHLLEVINNDTKEISRASDVQSPTQSTPPQPIQPIQPRQN